MEQRWLLGLRVLRGVFVHWCENFHLTFLRSTSRRATRLSAPPMDPNAYAVNGRQAGLKVDAWTPAHRSATSPDTAEQWQCDRR